MIAVPWLAVLIVDFLAGIFFLAGGVVSYLSSLSMHDVRLTYSPRRNSPRSVICGSTAVVTRMIGMKMRLLVSARRRSPTMRSCSSVLLYWLLRWG